MGLEVGKPFGVVARCSALDACFKSEDILDEVSDLVETTLEGSRDVFMHEESPSPGCNNVLPNPLDHSHVCSLPSQSPQYYLDEPINNFLMCDANVSLGFVNNMFSILSGNVDDYVSLGCFRGHDPSIDPDYACLKDMPKKVMWTMLFTASYDFCKAINKVKRILVLFGVISVIGSYLLFSKFWSQDFDKLLRALTMLI